MSFNFKVPAFRQRGLLLGESQLKNTVVIPGLDLLCLHAGYIKLPAVGAVGALYAYKLVLFVLFLKL